VCVVSGAGRYVDCSPHTSLHQKTHTQIHDAATSLIHNEIFIILITTHTQIHDAATSLIHNEIFIILISDFSQEIYVLPDDDDMQCAIETCRSSESVLMCIILD
jgi:hypothetical protein